MNAPGLAKKAPSVLLGDLLVKSRLIHMKDLADAIPISMKTGLPIGRILIGSGAIKESTMQAVLFAQSLVRDRLLDEQLAVEAIKEVDSSSCSLDDALAKLGWKREAYEMTNRLGELFLEAGIINKEQLEAGLEAFFSTGLPLARVLVLQGVITAPMAFTALRAQKFIRDEVVTRQQATDALWLAHHNSTKLEDSLNFQGYIGPEQGNSIRIGELLVLANAVNEIDVLEGVERSINNNRLIGEMMVADGKLPQYLLNAALELQRMTTTGELEPSAAGEALRRIYATGMTVEEAVVELTASVSLRTELLSLQPALTGNIEDKTMTAEELRGLVPVEQAAHTMGISVKTVTKRIKKGLLSGVKQNGKWFVWFPEEIACSNESDFTEIHNESAEQIIQQEQSPEAELWTHRAVADSPESVSPAESENHAKHANSNAANLDSFDQLIITDADLFGPWSTEAQSASGEQSDTPTQMDSLDPLNRSITETQSNPGEQSGTTTQTDSSDPLNRSITETQSNPGEQSGTTTQTDSSAPLIRSNTETQSNPGEHSGTTAKTDFFDPLNRLITETQSNPGEHLDSTTKADSLAPLNRSITEPQSNPGEHSDVTTQTDSFDLLNRSIDEPQSNPDLQSDITTQRDLSDHSNAQQDPFESLDPAAQSVQFEESDTFNYAPKSILDAVHTISWLDSDGLDSVDSSHFYPKQQQKNAEARYRLPSNKLRGPSRANRANKIKNLEPEDIKELMYHHLQLIEKLSSKLEALSYRTGFVEGKLAAYEEIASNNTPEE